MLPEHITELIRHHMNGDDSHFRATALYIAAKQARQGNTALAKEIRDLITTPPTAQPAHDDTIFTTTHKPNTHLADLVLNRELATQIARILFEYRQHHTLTHPLPQRFFFTGPEGTGKTTTARALATKLNLPLHELTLTSDTSDVQERLEKVFTTATHSPGVYLIPHIDTLNTPTHATLTHLLNNPIGRSLIIMTTHDPHTTPPENVDATLHFDLPDAGQTLALMRNHLAMLDTTSITYQEHAVRTALVVRKALKRQLSHAQISHALTFAVEKAKLTNQTRITATDIATALREYPQPR